MIRLIAVQMKVNIHDYRSPEHFRRRILSLTEQAVNSSGNELPTLVVFPEDAGVPCVFTDSFGVVEHIDGLADAIAAMIKHHLPKVFWTRLKRGVSNVPALLIVKARNALAVYLEAFREAAEKYGVYIVGGSIFVPDFVGNNPAGAIVGKGVYNVSFLFGPDGKIIGKQKKAYLMPIEAEDALHLTGGAVSELKVFDTELGRLGIGVCLDMFQDDVVDRLAKQRAEIIIQPSANPEAWFKEQQLDWLNGCHKALNRRPEFKYAVNAMLVGDLFDLPYEGQSSILKAGASLGLGYSGLGGMDSFIKVAKNSENEEILTAVVPHPREGS